MKPLLQVSTADVAALRERLADALADGPAIWPVPPSGGHEASVEIGHVDDGVAVVVETSGSTASPKRVLLSAAALRASAEATATALGGHGRWVLAVPAHYIAGVQVLVRSIVAGPPVVAMSDGSFTPDAFAAATMQVMRTRDALPRYTSLVPVQLARIVEAAEAEPSGHLARTLAFYAAILVGGQRVDPALVERATAFGARVVRTYGSSETAGGCVYDGRPLPGVRVREADGLIELGGPMLADGYLDDPERTAAAFPTDADGTRWYRTGDLGSVDEHGVLRITGRADDVIISGGVKVVLAEVERAVHGVPGFGEAVVVGVPDREWGERAAVVATRTAAAAASDALAALVAATDRAGLGPAARPSRLELVDALPRLSSGKPDRRALEARLRGDGAE
ncbi:AMP-binding protein [Agromyces aurantiacus]|uniref:AMP-binding protein n=1 Tax=Agromyces aurantiacus TaxID=165814 RepID=A0ABV9R896_9MICO|nr:AMP-binding protein [Agromyces aurantiacus]MBM7503260.1 O-succinylbenzoic acid--CoA ligase [Agromyces aurantiacus]